MVSQFPISRHPVTYKVAGMTTPPRVAISGVAAVCQLDRAPPGSSDSQTSLAATAKNRAISPLLTTCRSEYPSSCETRNQRSVQELMIGIRIEIRPRQRRDRTSNQKQRMFKQKPRNLFETIFRC